MTINNPDEFMDNLWDWAIVDGCFGNTRIKVSDLDGIVERNGKFLAYETKSPNVDIPTGQMIMFRHLIDTGYFTVMVIWGERNKPEKTLLMTSKVTQEYCNADTATLRHITSLWFSYANGTPPVKFSE